MEYSTGTLARPLNKDQYYPASYPKKRIILHHTAGGSAQSSIDWWNSTPDHVATAFIIDRDGKVYQNFDPKYWAYALGLTGGSSIEQTSIQIEICSWGPVQWDESKKNFVAVASPKTIVPHEEVFACPYRGNKFYQCYTQAQIDACVTLMGKLVDDFKIPVQEHLEGFWTLSNTPLKVGSGIYSHTTFRKDKSDIFPQPSFLQAIYNKFTKV